MRSCESCGASIEANRGRPRKFCTACRPPAYERKATAVAQCAQCGETSPRKYCSVRCRDLSQRFPCAGCGRPMWRGRSSLPEGQGKCLPCRRHGRGEKPITCAQCSRPFESAPSRDSWTRTCSHSCSQLLRLTKAGKPPGRDPEKVRANARAKNHRRRARLRGDVTPDYDRALRKAARTCPLCSVRLTDVPYVPHSKELDHIIPINVGGTHTIGNVRIICRLCNQKRPHDGSDFVGQPTLWATDPEVILKPVRAKKVKPTKVARPRKPSPPKPQPRPCRTCGVQVIPAGRGRPRQWCGECRPAASALRVAA